MENRWLTISELENDHDIPATLTRRWAAKLAEQGQARKSGFWLISQEAIPFLKSRCDSAGRLPTELTDDMINSVVAAWEKTGTISGVAKELGVAWKTARSLLSRCKLLGGDKDGEQ